MEPLEQTKDVKTNSFAAFLSKERQHWRTPCLAVEGPAPPRTGWQSIKSLQTCCFQLFSCRSLASTFRKEIDRTSWSCSRSSTDPLSCLPFRWSRCCHRLMQAAGVGKLAGRGENCRWPKPSDYLNRSQPARFCKYLQVLEATRPNVKT